MTTKEFAPMFKDICVQVGLLAILGAVAGVVFLHSRGMWQVSPVAPQQAAVLTAASTQVKPVPFASLTNYYRGMQLQGNVIKSQPTFFTATMPFELTDPALSFPYKIQPGGGNVELPYVTNFSIVRALGGHAKREGTGFVPVKDFDAIYMSTTTNTYAYRIDQLIAGLRYYTTLGYAPKNMILTLDNIPWAIAKTQCADGSPIIGFYGSKTAIADMAAYSTLIDKLGMALKAEYGTSASEFRYKIGAEYNGSEASCMTLDEYKEYYSATYKALAKHFPNPKLMPYEHAGSMTSRFDTAALYEWLVQNGMTPVSIPFSTHNIFMAGSKSNIDSTINGFENRYKSVYTKVPSLKGVIKPSIAQFGVLGSLEGPFDSAESIEHLDMFSGSYAFQSLMRERKNIDLDYSFHWDVMDPIKTSAGPDYPLTTGTSFVYQILDNLVGSDMFSVTTSQVPEVLGSRGYSVLFKKGSEYYLVVSKHTDRTVTNKNSSVYVTIPPGILPEGTGFTLAMTAANNGNLPVRKVLDAIGAGSIPGVGVKEMYKTPAMLSNTRLMIAPTDSSNIFVAIRKVGDAIYKNPVVNQSVVSATRSLFTLKPYSSTLLKANAGGGYTLNALRFDDNEIKVFQLTPLPAPLKATQSKSLSFSPNPCVVTGTSTVCTVIASFSNSTAKPQQVWVKVDDKESLMLCSATNVKRPVSWIVPSKQYTFTVHAATGCTVNDRKEVLETVSVYGSR